ncbi:uncharacterized protein N7482_004049 [Penicillium canariense]|uniref:C2H2-type domain-containing protein n=1 Tax=Penicillium canariense TaxID=189055 RepID=A0A9W9I8E2_9EURO|nr:uncharacterized protein N7482_004049 [Penicillium canariense]KAJ5168455.1 hypothetical protein N7482_004049 [Penicillium canariense]
MSSKPYQCQRCSRGFARLEHLQRHDRSHTKEKPYVCVQCPKAFTRKDLLVRHERLAHQPEASPGSNQTQTPSPAHPILDGLDTLASVVTNHARTNRRAPSRRSPHFADGLPAHRTPVVVAQLPNPETPSAAPPTPLPASDFGYSLSGLPGSYEGNDFTSFLDSVPLPSHPFSPAFQPLPLFPPLQYSPATDYEQPSERDHATETASTPSNSVLPRHGAQLPSLQPEGYQSSPKARQPTGFVPVTAQCRDKALRSLADYTSVVPDPSLPSRHALSRCLTGYLMGFHDHYPIVHKPTLDVDSMSLPLLLSMAALGARYSREPDMSMRVYQIAKLVTLECFRRVFMSGTMPSVNVSNDKDTLELLQALLMLLAVSSWFINNPPYHEAMSFRSSMATLLRKDGINRLPEFDGTWTSWIHRECVKRTKLIVCCFFNIHTIVFDIPPVILTEELSLDLPCTEKEWQAPRADIWQVARSQSPGEPNIQEALSALFTPNSGMERFSSLGGYVLIHALLQDIWLMTKAGRLALSRCNRLGSSIASTPELVATEQALERWCQCWERNQESSIDPLSPHGPISFTSAALLRLAYIRLNADCGSARQLQTWDPVQIATSLNDNLHVQRGDRLTRAALHCAHALSTPVKLGIGFVAHSQVALWSNQHALCSLECAVVLAKWLEAVTGRDPDPGLTEQETRLRDFVLEMVMEVQHGVSREWLLATNTRLSAAVARLWARLFTADYIWEMVNLIGRSLNSYADLLEQKEAGYSEIEVGNR